MPIFAAGGKKLRLAYCTNVHAAEDLEGIERDLDRFAVPVRARVAPPGGRLGVGLWLAARVAARLARDAGSAERLRRFLDERGLVCFTLNAFPFGGFHAARVKHDVYRPAWEDEARAHFTLDAARALARLLPDDEPEGTISTLPIGWRSSYDGEIGARFLAEAAGRVAATLHGLAALRAETGKSIRLLFEPEPGCRLETTADAIAASELCEDFTRGRGAADVFERHAGICFDCCHQAVMGEDLVASLRALRAREVTIGKVHLSSAVVGPVAALRALDEPRYLHQVVACDGRARADDLAGLAADPAWDARRARVHFHVPIHAATLDGGLETTQPALAAALDEVLSWPNPPDLEVETYTWSVLPAARVPGFDLAAGLAGEVRWALDRIEARLGKAGPC